jgi:hypothetical protein
MRRRGMNPTQDLSWLIGQGLRSVELQDYTWCFSFSNGGSICTESLWRLVSSERIVVTSADHGHVFGLPEPVDASKLVLAATYEQTVVSLSIVPTVSDLLILFSGNAQLQFLNTSCGYEGWRTSYQSGEVICIGGGRISVLPSPAPPN